MRRRSFLVLLLFLLIGAAGCRRGMFTERGPSPIEEVEGNEYYTQIGMWIEGGKHETTNYSRGWFLPVNSKVKILSTTSSTIEVWAAERKKTFTIVNVREYTQRGIKGIFDRYFGKNEVDLSTFSKEVRRNIRDGELRRGMSRDAALLARGYPPAHRTSSLDDAVWFYWTARFNRVQVTFSDDEIVRIKD